MGMVRHGVCALVGGLRPARPATSRAVGQAADPAAPPLVDHRSSSFVRGGPPRAETPGTASRPPCGMVRAAGSSTATYSLVADPHVGPARTGGKSILAPRRTRRCSCVPAAACRRSARFEPAGTPPLRTQVRNGLFSSMGGTPCSVPMSERHRRSSPGCPARRASFLVLAMVVDQQLPGSGLKPSGTEYRSASPPPFPPPGGHLLSSPVPRPRRPEVRLRCAAPERTSLGAEVGPRNTYGPRAEVVDPPSRPSRRAASGRALRRGSAGSGRRLERHVHAELGPALGARGARVGRVVRPETGRDWAVVAGGGDPRP